MNRLRNVDAVRGAIMILMAIDHVRVYSAVPAGSPDPAVFFTRWVTHFCAPGFVFLAGTSAFLVSERRTLRETAVWLLERGALLVFLELTWMRLAWTFNLDFQHYLLAGVLWVLGWSMIVLAGLLFLPRWAIAALGLAGIFLHGLLGPHPGALWAVLHDGGELGPLKILYVLVPWACVMAAGFAFGPLVRNPRACVVLGLSCIALFLALRATGAYGDPRAWAQAGPPAMAAPLRFLNTAKYPASLQFLLMTLGPISLALAFARGAFLETFGRVPLFYYLLHIPLIHALALGASALREGHVDAWLFANHPVMPPQPPEGYRWPLWTLYAVTALAVALLYPACRWYAGEKARGRGLRLI